ncbi:MAG: NUDIX domain-containing protein [Candidatus Nomurabacteria bacterium]|nr:MAG: NUDIX domain-containing protein [Candidatus Nomurabacteria bacterium]
MNSHELNKIVNTPELDVVRVVSLRNNSSEVLLVQEVDDINWKLPGGKIHEAETIFEAFEREIEEELGFKPTREMIVNYVSANIPDSENIRHIFLINEVDESSIIQTEEVAEARYFNLEELPETKFSGHISSAVKLIIK